MKTMHNYIRWYSSTISLELVNGLGLCKRHEVGRGYVWVLLGELCQEVVHPQGLPGRPAYGMQHRLMYIQALARGLLKDVHSSKEMRDICKGLQENLGVICKLSGGERGSRQFHPKTLLLQE
jgi:hypothetical protein